MSLREHSPTPSLALWGVWEGPSERGMAIRELGARYSQSGKPGYRRRTQEREWDMERKFRRTQVSSAWEREEPHSGEEARG